MRDPAMGEPKKRITRMRYNVGPMGFLSDQIMKEMQRAGYPAKEFNLYRPAKEQERMVKRGVSRAGPYSSAHQYYCATDIIHERWAWFAHQDAPKGDMFWNCLWDCAQVVSEKFGVEFDRRISWDSAHIELTGWEQFKAVVGLREPSPDELDDWFAKALPKVWKQYIRCLEKKETLEGREHRVLSRFSKKRSTCG